MSGMPWGISNKSKCLYLGNSSEPFGLKSGSHEMFQKIIYFLQEKTQEAANISI